MPLLEDLEQEMGDALVDGILSLSYPDDIKGGLG